MKRTRLIRKIPGDDEDRLSALPDCVLCYILSFLDTKYAVQTCVLSKRYKNLWSSLPNLNFDKNSLKRLSSFTNFVDQVLTLRDNSVKVNDFKFSSRRAINSYFLGKVVNYAMSHGVQGLNLDIHYDGIFDFLESWHSSESLKTLELKSYVYFVQLRNPLSFPKLKILHLERVSFEHLSCPSVRDLTLIGCAPYKLDTWNINAPQLTKLTITSGCFELVAFKVVVSAPRLASFCYSGSRPLSLSMGEQSGLEVISIDIDRYGWWERKKEVEKKVALDLVNLLQLFHNAKSVTLSLGTIEVLSLFPDLLAHERSPFGNMKSLKFKASRKCSTLGIPAHVRTYLLNNSSKAELFMELPRCYRCPRHKRCKHCL
ncbi:F-box/LRR-repeat protein [Forsythia ovata]|uniref:F-box/LRR-repeat protein n=1 Tax=Forsythia ovata TaxID=205694 RepID=A0ABD1TQG5_9LAMI